MLTASQLNRPEASSQRQLRYQDRPNPSGALLRDDRRHSYYPNCLSTTTPFEMTTVSEPTFGSTLGGGGGK